VPIQDVLGLGTKARMNRPGKAKGNWRWRLRKQQLRPSQLKRMAELTVATGRWRQPA